MASHLDSRAKEVISTSILIAAPLCILLISSTSVVLGCPLSAGNRPERDTMRPRSGTSEYTQRVLEKNLRFSGSTSRLAANPAPAETEAPEQVDLGVFRPTGHVNPDGSEVCVPRDDSILAGRIEVDVREDGRVIRQKVLRPLRASDIVLAFNLSPNVEESKRKTLTFASGMPSAPGLPCSSRLSVY